MSVTDKISKLTDKPVVVKSCIFAAPGVGKTVFSATAPKPLIIDVEDSTLSLHNHPELAAKADIFKPDKHEEIEDIIWEAREGNLDQYETFVIDTGTELQARHLSELVREKSRKDASRDPYLAYIQDYKVSTEVLRRLFIAFADLGRNLIITAHENEFKDEQSGRVTIRPAFTPKVHQTLRGLMDVIGHMTLSTDEEKNVVRRLQVQPGGIAEVKTRLGHLPPVLINPTFSDLLPPKIEEKE